MSTPAKDAEGIRAYYDDFASGYEDKRGDNDPRGYHALIDDLEVGLVERWGRGEDVLEVGCGTGLILERAARFARTAKGVDLSPGMLEKARARGLDVREGSATALPYGDDAFNVAYSFKVLAHVPEIRLALAEMARVTRPGGHLIAELYNPLSLRGLVKKLGPAGRISRTKKEDAVYTRFDAPWAVADLMPEGCEIVASRGVRIVTPAALAMRVPGLRRVLWTAEHLLADSPLAVFGGFYAVVAQRKF